MKTEIAVVYIVDDDWVAEVNGKVYKISDQHPFHASITRFRDENRRAEVVVFESRMGKMAEFVRFI